MELKEYTLDELLPYEQPTKYIVESTKYDDSYETPVLTAGKSFILGYTDEKEGIFEKDRLPVIIFDDFTTASQFVNFPFKVKSSAMKILNVNTELVLPKYIYYRMQTIQIEHDTHKRYWIQHYSKIKIQIPSIEEQEKVVAKIEEIFSQIDEGVNILLKTKEQIDIYRQSVLNCAFSEMEESKNLDEIAMMIDPQPSHRTPAEVEGGIPYIGIGDIDYESRKVLFATARKVSGKVLEEHLNRYTLDDGDFVMGKIGTIGKPYRLPLPQNYALSANVILIKPNADIIEPDFLFWQFSSPLVTLQLLKGASATSQPAFGIKKARLLEIKICSLERQKEVVMLINEKMSVCDQIEITIKKALLQAESMRQSILKKAFEGRLV